MEGQIVGGADKDMVQNPEGSGLNEGLQDRTEGLDEGLATGGVTDMVVEQAEVSMADNLPPPSSNGGSPLSFAQIVRGSPSAGGESTAVGGQESDCGKLNQEDTGKENRQPLVDKGKRVWVDSPLVPIQPKRGGKGGRGRGKR
ncbi:unnamed protein product [Linum trigynum]|uniref:Uncharacterized protein n=1 Tax=Linum trigynum TaxID=586398 RepID=A0AAV2EVG4_9ROSI